MLDIDCRIDVDAGRQQFLDILIALVVAAAGGIAVRQLVDQHQLGPPGEDGIHVHLGQHPPLMIVEFAGDELQAVGPTPRFRPAVGLDHADHHIGAGLLASARFGQHLVGLAHARRRTKKDLETAAALLGGGAQKGIGIGRASRGGGELTAPV